MLLVNAIDRLSLELLLNRYGLELRLVAPEEVIPGSYWGEREAGLIGAKIFARLDTPLHSVLHESAHFICMTPERRAGLDTDAWAGSACAAIWMTGATPSGLGWLRLGLPRTPRIRGTG